MNYTIPPRYKAGDMRKGQITQDEIIALQIANDANISRARKALRLGEPSIPTPEQVASPDELLADDAAQEAQARSNIMKLGFKDKEAVEIVANIRTDPELSYIQLNQNFPAIETDIKNRFNVRLLTPSFFIEYFRKYSETLDGVAGTRVFKGSRGFNRSVDTVAELRTVLPDPSVIEFIRLQAQNSKIFGKDLIQELGFLREILPSAEDLRALSNLNPVRQQEIIEKLLKQFADMPSNADIREIANLIRDDRMDRETLIDNITNIVNAIPRGNQKNIVEDEVRESPKKMEDEKEVMKTPKKATPTVEDDVTDYFNTGTIKSLRQIKALLKQFPDVANLLRNKDTGEKVDINNLTKDPPSAARRKKGKVVWYGNTNLIELLSKKILTPPSSATAERRPMSPTLGRGIMTRKYSKKTEAKVGRGLSIKETPSYKQYGKYAIHIPQLEQQDILNVKYKSLGGIPKFKPVAVSDIFRDFILDLLETGKTNVRVYNQIPTEERKLFEEMSIGAGVWNSLGLKRTTTNTDDEENKRFELLKGEYTAGNNNPKVISELRRLVVKMIGDGRIRRSQGVELLMELS
jgi:hypothetical protein